MDSKKVVFLIPSYQRVVDPGVLAMSHQMSKKHQVLSPMNSDTSACCLRFNMGLIFALDQYEQGNADYFLLWHSDIIPEPYFLDKMIDIAEAKNADVLSVVSPIKDEKGLTSTAIDEPVGDFDPEYRVRRLTMTEIMEKDPTFTDPKILVNTGLLLIKLSAPWVQDIYFHFDDKIIKYHGRRQAVLMPEDWMFSRDARKLGCTSQWVTREVAVRHVGHWLFSNDAVWGTMKTDTQEPTPKELYPAVEAANKIQGWMSWEELIYLAERAKDAKCIVELGSWKGRSTKAMAMMAKGKLYAVDSWRGSTNGDATGVEADTRGRDVIKEVFVKNVAEPHPNVVVVDVQHEFAGTSLKHLAGEVDYAFVDGDHSYEHVKRDIITCLDLMAPGGTLSGHDFNEPGVEKAVRELLPEASLIEGTSIWQYRVPVLAKVTTE